MASRAHRGRLPDTRWRWHWLWRSLASRLVLALLVFITVPILLYEQFREADAEKQVLLLRSAQQQGQLVARALEPVLSSLEKRDLTRLGEKLEPFADANTSVRLLLSPALPPAAASTGLPGGEGFFYVASAPVVPTALLDVERQRLVEQGVLGKLAGSCAGNLPLAIPVRQASGGTELLTSITPIRTAMGCWAVVTSHRAAAYLGAGAGRPYWQTPEVQAATLVYLAMAALIMLLLVEIWRNLRRFGAVARSIGQKNGPTESFAAQNRVPELALVAEDFDRLVATLHSSAANLRRAAEDNAHAFKTPIAVIRQSLEPLKKLVPPQETRGRRALDLIEGSVEKLDGLVSFARRMDETTADLLEPPRQRIDLSALLNRVLQGYRGLVEQRDVSLSARVDPGIEVRAGEELLETVIENIIDNALSFSPPGSTLRIILQRREKGVDLVVEDQGPGVDASNLDRIFERYFSQRPGEAAEMADEEGMPHYGIGLWIVRRNVEAVGGRVCALNRAGGGLSVRVSLPVIG